ncbi:MAG: hydrogenase maturation nickel metallochaperone HypA, partial [Bacteroidetes bacterium]
MHEISLVRQIFRTLDEQFTPTELQALKRIKLKVGLLANVEPTLLQNAYAAVLATDRQAQAGVELEVELVPIQIACPSCREHSVI